MTNEQFQELKLLWDKAAEHGVKSFDLQSNQISDFSYLGDDKFAGVYIDVIGKFKITLIRLFVYCCLFKSIRIDSSENSLFN